VIWSRRLARAPVRDHEIELELNENELARLDLWSELHGGDRSDALMALVRHAEWRDECRERGL
jgi:hypothetical protein